MAAPPEQSLTDNYKNPYTGETTREIVGRLTPKKEEEQKPESISPSVCENVESTEKNVFKRDGSWFKSLFS